MKEEEGVGVDLEVVVVAVVGGKTTTPPRPWLSRVHHPFCEAKLSTTTTNRPHEEPNQWWQFLRRENGTEATAVAVGDGGAEIAVASKKPRLRCPEQEGRKKERSWSVLQRRRVS